MRFVPHGEYCQKLTTVIYLTIDRACGIAPDGTRVAKTERDSGIMTHGQARGIPSKKDHSPRSRYSIGALPHCENKLINCSGVLVRRLSVRPMINPSPLLIAMPVWALWPLPQPHDFSGACALCRDARV
jgi:hypothetical protein